MSFLFFSFLGVGGGWVFLVRGFGSDEANVWVFIGIPRVRGLFIRFDFDCCC